MIDDEIVLCSQWKQGLLGRRKAGRIPHTSVDVGDLAGLPIVATGVGGEDDVLKNRAYFLAIDPEQDRCLGQACLNIEMVVLQGHTAIPIGRPGKDGA